MYYYYILFKIILFYYTCKIESKILKINKICNNGFILNNGYNLKCKNLHIFINEDNQEGSSSVIIPIKKNNFKNIFLFNVAHKLNEGRRLLDYYTIPLDKQKLSISHFKSYFIEKYSEKMKELDNIINKYEINKIDIEELINRMCNCFLSKILDKFIYIPEIKDYIIYNRQIDLMYVSDLMASYILLFSSKSIKNILFKYIWTNWSILDSNNYICCNYLFNQGIHDEELHSKFDINSLSKDEIIDILRLHKNYLSFLKIRSRKKLKELDKVSLFSLFQTLMVKLHYGHYIYYDNVEENELNKKTEKGYLDNVYNFIIKYRERIKDYNKVKKLDTIEESIFGNIKSEENLLFLNNLFNYEKYELYNLIVIYLSSLPELQQITNPQIYLNYLSLNKLTLIKLLFLEFSRVSKYFPKMINDHYNGLEVGKEVESVKSEYDSVMEGKDVILFELDELKNLVNFNYINKSKNKNLLKRIRLDNKIKDCLFFTTERTEDVLKSILRHPPHFEILLKLLNSGENYNDKIMETLSYLNSINYGDTQNLGSTNSVIRNKKVDVILNSLEKNELEELYNRFLDEIYPFKPNTFHEIDSSLIKNYEGDLLGDENVELRYGENEFGEIKEDDIGEIERILDEIKKKFSKVKELIASFLVGSPENDPKSDSIEEKLSFEELVNKDEEELNKILEEKVKSIEQDENTLKIKYDLDPRNNMFTILNGKRHSKLYSMSPESSNLTFLGDDRVEEVESNEDRRIRSLKFGDEVKSPWERLGLEGEIIDSALSYLHYSSGSNWNLGNYYAQMFKPSFIQRLGIPEILKKNGKNVVISGTAGDGKTLTYLLPIIQSLKDDEKTKLREKASPRCLIIAPTSELSSQICKVIKTIGHLLKFSVVPLNKSQRYSMVKKRLDDLVDIVVTTPKKLKKYRHLIKFNKLKYVVLEEADSLLNEGFFDQIYEFLQCLYRLYKESCDNSIKLIQVSTSVNYLKYFNMCCENYEKYIKRSSKQVNKGSGRRKMVKPKNYNYEMVRSLLLDNNEVVVDEVNTTRPARGVNHVFLDCNKINKCQKLVDIIRNQIKYNYKYSDDVGIALSSDDIGRADSFVSVDNTENTSKTRDNKKIVIFCNRVSTVRYLDYYLNEIGIEAISAHGSMPYRMRKKNMKLFEESKNKILITTDFLSRGLDFNDLDALILFDFPLNPQEYIRKSSLLSHKPVHTYYFENDKKPKSCFNLIEKKDKILSEAIRRSLYVGFFPLHRLSSRKSDYDIITGRLKYLTQAGGYYKFLKYLRDLEIEGNYKQSEMHKHLDKFREIIKLQYENSMKKIKLRRIKICKKRRELMKKLKMYKKFNKAIRLKQKIISEMDKSKNIYTKIDRNCPSFMKLNKIRYELLKLKLLKGYNEKLLKRSTNQILGFINKLQNKLINHMKLIESITDSKDLEDSDQQNRIESEGYVTIEALNEDTKDRWMKFMVDIETDVTIEKGEREGLGTDNKIEVKDKRIRKSENKNIKDIIQKRNMNTKNKNLIDNDHKDKQNKNIVNKLEERFLLFKSENKNVKRICSLI